MMYEDEDEGEDAAAEEGEEDDIVPLEAVTIDVCILKEGSAEGLVCVASTCTACMHACSRSQNTHLHACRQRIVQRPLCGLSGFVSELVEQS